MKDNENIDKYLDIARELKKTVEYKGKSDTNSSWALGMVPKSLEKRIEELEMRGRIETTQTTAWLKSAGILRSVMET